MYDIYDNLKIKVIMINFVRSIISWPTLLTIITVELTVIVFDVFSSSQLFEVIELYLVLVFVS